LLAFACRHPDGDWAWRHEPYQSAFFLEGLCEELERLVFAGTIGLKPVHVGLTGRACRRRALSPAAVYSPAATLVWAEVFWVPETTMFRVEGSKGLGSGLVGAFLAAHGGMPLVARSSSPLRDFGESTWIPLQHPGWQL
jgi:hypothetical protein